MGIKADTTSLEKFGKKFQELTEDNKKTMYKEFGQQGGQKSTANRHNQLAALKITQRANRYINASVSWAIKKLTTRIQDDIQNKYNEQVRLFYNDYSGGKNGLSYDRTYSLFQAYKPVYYREGDKHYIGAEISGENIPYSPYFSIYDRSDFADPWYVFDLFYYEGQHGADIYRTSKKDNPNSVPIWFAPKMSTPAHSEMRTWWDGYKSKVGTMFDEELEKAFKHNKSLLNK